MRGLFISIALFLGLIVFAQEPYPKKYFFSPVDFQLLVSSNFGKIRTNHFHAGLDINTKLRTGLNIYAVADGYISRVNISPRGYGKAIYITHQNGYVSVYAHLSEIKKSVSDFVHKVQHERHQFKVDLQLPEGQFPVRKGEIIGKSGNTGRSFGAHLHFEIREQESEKILNPFLFGFNVSDNEPPRIKGVYLYRFSDEIKHGGHIEKKLLRINGRDTISSFGKLGLGVEIRDYLSKNNGNFDVYQISLLFDDSLCFHYKFNKFSFDESRYINSFIDYNEFRISGKKIIKCFIEPNNKLSIYEPNLKGFLHLDDGKLHKLSLIAADIRGNTTNLNFYIKSDSSKVLLPFQKEKSIEKFIDYSKIEEFRTDSFRILFHKDCLYDHLNFNYNVSHSLASKYSKYHYVHNPSVPLHNSATISIKPLLIPEHLKDKAIIANVGRKGSLTSMGGVWNDYFIETNILNFGIYIVTLDTIAPTIERLFQKNRNNRQIKKSKFLNFVIKDELSGVDEFVAFIDGKWALFEYDEKNNVISCNLHKEKILEGKHHLVLWVRDKCDNLSFYESQFDF